MSEFAFSLAGAEMAWPLATSAGLTNHPNIEVVAQRFDSLTRLGLSETMLGSVVLGAPRGGNAHVQLPNGKWDYLGGDEYVDVQSGIGHNAKGLPGCGTDIMLNHIKEFVDLGRSRQTEVSLSVSPHTQSPLDEAEELLEVGRKALEAGVLRVEFNLSCPNIPDRPPFYKDTESMLEFIELVDRFKRLTNRYGHPGLYPKFGPMSMEEDEIKVRQVFADSAVKGLLGGVVTSNTIFGQGHINEDGTNEISVNGGRAGQSGPFYTIAGQYQAELWSRHSTNPAKRLEIVSSLGVSSGNDVSRRLNREGATMCQLGSILYWPQLLGEASQQSVAVRIKEEFVAASVNPHY